MKETKLKSHTGAEISFTTEVSGYDTKLIICSFGPDFSGKSRFAVTGPTKNGLVGIVPTDRKTRLTVLTAMEQLGKKGRILIPKDDLVREVNPSKLGWSANVTDEVAEEKSKAHYRAHVDRVKEVAYALHAHPDVSMICIDLFQQFYQDVKYAHYGRKQFALKRIGKKKEYFQDTKEADQELIDFINSLSDKHLLLTHKCKDEYDNDVNTGKQTWEGYKYMGNHVNLVIEHHNNKKWDANKDDEVHGWHYGLSIRRCQWNTDVEGESGNLILKDDWVSFQSLAMAVFPNADQADFE